MSATFTYNGETRAWTGTTVAALLAEAGIAPDRGGVAVAVNAEIVPRPDWGARRIEPDDRVEVVHIVRGG